MNLQSPERMALIKVWDAMFRGARKYVEDNGFIGVHNAPEVVGITGACENVDTLFRVDYFGQRAYLAQSDQLYLELLTPHLKKVYAEIQSFRAEPDVDARHLTQFSLFEIEHQGNLGQLQGHIEGILTGAVDRVLYRCPYELGVLGVSEEHIARLNLLCDNRHLLSITYTEAIADLRPHFPDLVWGDDLKAKHEAKLAQMHGAHFVTHYPLDLKFFNMKESSSPDQPGRVVNSCDLILPFSGESAGAAERETKHDVIERRLKSSDMYKRLIELGGTDEDFAWYLDAHKDKCIQDHAGAGIGMARVAQFILGKEDIRDAVPFVINRDTLL